jgi:hypothetical protein
VKRLDSVLKYRVHAVGVRTREVAAQALVDGVDVMRLESGVRNGDACRLDLPTPQRVLDGV